MKVFKFGGASVKDAEAVRNLKKVLSTQGIEAGVLVVSAMGKTTNALEGVVVAYFENEDWKSLLLNIKKMHIETADELLSSSETLIERLNFLFTEVEYFLEKNKSPNASFVYDQVVSVGELASTTIISYYLSENHYENQWLDARDYIKTNNQYQEGIVDWQHTESNITTLNNNKLFVTQGFIGSDEHGFTTTLGREGSDYSAAIFAYALNAEAMTIWKDVPGVMNADPRYFSNAELLPSITYEEAIEMAYFGASVIHPKTLQPLKQKNIPFFVKSFLAPEMPGTFVSGKGNSELTEIYILKQNQRLLSVSTRDFSFIAEDHIGLIFNTLSEKRIKVSLLQNSAISLMLCLEDKFDRLEEVVEMLQPKFRIHTQSNLSLLTIRNLKSADIDNYKKDKEIVLEQLSRNTLQLVFVSSR